MSDDFKSDCVYKVLLLGDSTVGKTCFLMRYTDNTFQEIHMSTIGLDYRLKNITLENGKNIKIQIWDTAGQDRFRAITKNYYKGAHGIILIYDITNRQTFDNVNNWLSQIKEEAMENVTIFLIANKVDDELHRTVNYDEGKNLSDEYKLQFFETSAKTGKNVDECFTQLVKQIDVVNGSHNNELKNGKKLGNEKEKKRGCC